MTIVKNTVELSSALRFRQVGETNLYIDLRSVTRDEFIKGISTGLPLSWYINGKEIDIEDLPKVLKKEHGFFFMRDRFVIEAYAILPKKSIVIDSTEAEKNNVETFVTSIKMITIEINPHSKIKLANDTSLKLTDVNIKMDSNEMPQLRYERIYDCEVYINLNNGSMQIAYH